MQLSHIATKEPSDREGLRDPGDQEPSTAHCSRVLVVAVYITELAVNVFQAEPEGMPFNDKKGFGEEKKEVHKYVRVAALKPDKEKRIMNASRSMNGARAGTQP
ncbi:hypothetical protein R3P38DRAFT_2777108 [Favolaschia claudopus]|uniref:Uncharacterized protein n=1 Tax=Favolaschia claudopus TaxID=2862362 RepID=A0AAW0BJ90_9AGAR